MIKIRQAKVKSAYYHGLAMYSEKAMVDQLDLLQYSSLPKLVGQVASLY